MPNKMIPFPCEIKITPSDFCYYGIYYSNEDRHSGSLFIIFMKTNSERIEIKRINVNIYVV